MDPLTTVIDRLGAFSKVSATPQNGIEVPAVITRCGVFTYTLPDGRRERHLRHPDDVFDKDSLKSLRSCTVTIDHPQERVVNALNWKRTSVGHLTDFAPTRGKYISANLVIQDADACDRVEKKELTEVSMGYTRDLVREAGMYEGEPYDARQKNIRYSHVAIGPKGWGRAGPDIRIELDSQASISECPVAEGVCDADYTGSMDPVLPVAAPAVVNVLDASAFVSKAEHEKLQGQLDTEREARVAAEAKATKAEAAALPASLDSLVSDRAKLIEAARKIAGKDFSCDGKTSDEVRRAALKTADPKIVLDGKSADYVEARFDSKVDLATAVVDSHLALHASLNAPVTDATDKVAVAEANARKAANSQFTMVPNVTR